MEAEWARKSGNGGLREDEQHNDSAAGEGQGE